MNISALTIHDSKTTALPAISPNCIDCPDFDCADNRVNGLLRLDLYLKGPQDWPPYLARLYYKNQMLGRFLIELNRRTRSKHIELFGNVNVRHGDILEWYNDGRRGLGFVSKYGFLKKLDMLNSIDFRKDLLDYLRTRRIDCIASYIQDTPAKNRKIHNSAINNLNYSEDPW